MIVDPNKLTLEGLSAKVAYNLGKQEDLHLSKDVTSKGYDMRKTSEDFEVMAPKLPSY
jgi:hypothetical protein